MINTRVGVVSSGGLSTVVSGGSAAAQERPKEEQCEGEGRKQIWAEATATSTREQTSIAGEASSPRRRNSRARGSKTRDLREVEAGMDQALGPQRVRKDGRDRSHHRRRALGSRTGPRRGAGENPIEKFQCRDRIS